MKMIYEASGFQDSFLRNKSGHNVKTIVSEEVKEASSLNPNPVYSLGGD
jgi:hypothetical protein